jgi:hypothetical protein
MAGKVRKRIWTTRKGEEKTAWVADYFDQHRHRYKKQFATLRRERQMTEAAAEAL